MLHISADYDIEAWVETSGDSRRFNEYRQEQKDDTRTDKAGGLTEGYLECEEGAAFKIKFRILRPEIHPEMRISCKIDGRDITGRAIPSDSNLGCIGYMFVREDGETSVADLSFATMPKTDEESLVEVRGAAVSELCKIEIWFEQGHMIQNKEITMDSAKPTEARIGLVHEKQLKLGSTIQATNKRPVKAEVSYAFVPAKIEPFICRFLWNYHTRTNLNLMGITKEEVIPAAVSSIGQRMNPSVKREGELNAARSSSGGKRVKTEGAKVKQEKNGQGSQNKPIVISDIDAPRRISGIVGGVIDLTDD